MFWLPSAFSVWREEGKQKTEKRGPQSVFISSAGLPWLENGFCCLDVERFFCLTSLLLLRQSFCWRGRSMLRLCCASMFNLCYSRPISAACSNAACWTQFILEQSGSLHRSAAAGQCRVKSSGESDFVPFLFFPLLPSDCPLAIKAPAWWEVQRAWMEVDQTWKSH